MIGSTFPGWRAITISGLITSTCPGKKWVFGVLLTASWDILVHLPREIGSSQISQYRGPCVSTTIWIPSLAHTISAMLPSELGRSWVWPSLLVYLVSTLCYLSEFCRWANGATLQMFHLLIKATGLFSLLIMVSSFNLLVTYLLVTSDLILIHLWKLISWFIS